MTGRVERRKEATKDKIITTAIQLFRQVGFDQTTMEQIAQEADIAKGTLYNYFPVKEAILSAYIEQSFENQRLDRLAALQNLPDTRARLTLILGQIMERVQVQPEIFERYLAYRIQQVVSLRPDPGQRVKSDFDLLAAAIIELGQQSGEIRADLPLDMMVDLFEFIFVEVAKQFYRGPDTFDAQQVIKQAISLFMNGVKNA